MGPCEWRHHGNEPRLWSTQRPKGVSERNAGGVITEDAIRSLAISQRLLGTREIMLIHHSDCGMLTFTDDEFKAQIEADTGLRPGWAAE